MKKRGKEEGRVKGQIGREYGKGRRQERRGGKDGFAVNCTTDDQVLKGK